MHVSVEGPETHWTTWPTWRVSRVTSRSFYVASDGTRERFLLVEWDSWLLQLGRRGRVHVDGRPVDLPDGTSHEEPLDQLQPRPEHEPSRLLRRGRALSRRGGLLREPDATTPGQALVCPDGPRPRWRVALRPDWTGPPACSCHSAEDPPPHGLCEHAVAACLTWGDLRCQLVDLLLDS